MKPNFILVGSMIATGGLLAAALTGAAAPDRGVHKQADERETWVRELAAVAAMDPTDASTRMKLAGVLDELGRHRDAQRWRDEAMRIDPSLFDSTNAPLGEGGVAGGTFPTSGADVIVGSLPNVTRWGRANNITAYSVGTTSCNAGDENLLWIASTNQHPVIAQHMYRLKDNRFEMIGQSWLKHGFTALTGSICSQMFGYGCNGQGGSVLGVGCSDPYSSSLNGSYTWLGPKHEVNATTGFFPYPHGSYPNNSPIGKRLQVHDDYLDPDINDNALYYVEGHYIASDDAAAGNGLNNASYRRTLVSETSSNVFNLTLVGETVRMLPAIYAWKQNDPSVEIVEVDVPDDGRFIIAYKVWQDEDDPTGETWVYEYAVHNLNSNRSAGSLSIPTGGADVTDVRFHDVDWHSGAPYTNEPWDVTTDGDAVTWATEDSSVNMNANALRWGTLYNFGFKTTAAPAKGEATLGMFRTGTPTEVVANVLVPEAQDVPGDLTGDGIVDGADLAVLLGAWGPCEDCDACPADLTGDCDVSGDDLAILLGEWS